MPDVADLVHETTVGTGTGNLTLAAVLGKRTFNTAFGTGGTDLFDYFISNRAAAEWEVGTGHLSDATTLVRDTVVLSSNSNNAVNFSAGTKDVANDAPASVRNALVFASEAEAKAGTSTTTYMNPLRTKQAIDAFNQLLHVRDEKAAGTQGGTFTAGDWRTRTLNTSLTNEITGASLGSNQITLPAGTYYIDAVLPFTNGAAAVHKGRLQNITDTTTTVLGNNVQAVNSGSSGASNSVFGKFTIAAEKVFEVQHRTTTTRSNDGFGADSSFATEVYADVQIWKIG
ncbi:MAG: hypothetical protein Q8P46_15055 [Hyphomicrobiales bacterium]|nr:hypothetical protein [Hyphomicrobiales bacterium]